MILGIEFKGGHMSEDESSYRIQWKGSVSGPHTRGELQKMLGCGEISLLHRVEVDGQWKSLDEFLNSAKPHFAPSSPPAAADDTASLGPAAYSPFSSTSRAASSSAGFPSSAAYAAGAAVANSPTPPSSPSAAPASSASAASVDSIQLIGNILCGACFLLPFFATIPALVVALQLQARGAQAQARQLFILCPVLTLAGVFFWVAARLAWNAI
jgi:hypothetical protein